MSKSRWSFALRFVSLSMLSLLAACGTDPAGEASETDSGLLDTTENGSGDAALNDTESELDAAPDTQQDTTPEDVAPDSEADTVADTIEDTTTALGEIPCEVATILETNCQECHGAVPIYGAAFSLLTMADLLSPSFTDPSRSVGEVTLERISDPTAPMPPAPRPLLTAAEIATLTAWVNGGSPAGEACLPPDTDAGSDTGSDTAGDTGVDPDRHRHDGGPGYGCRHDGGSRYDGGLGHGRRHDA